MIPPEDALLNCARCGEYNTHHAVAVMPNVDIIYVCSACGVVAAPLPVIDGRALARLAEWSGG